MHLTAGTWEIVTLVVLLVDRKELDSVCCWVICLVATMVVTWASLLVDRKGAHWVSVLVATLAKKLIAEWAGWTVL